MKLFFCLFGLLTITNAQHNNPGSANGAVISASGNVNSETQIDTKSPTLPSPEGLLTGVNSLVQSGSNIVNGVMGEFSKPIQSFVNDLCNAENRAVLEAIRVFNPDNFELKINGSTVATGTIHNGKLQLNSNFQTGSDGNGNGGVNGNGGINSNGGENGHGGVNFNASVNGNGGINGTASGDGNSTGNTNGNGTTPQGNANVGVQANGSASLQGDGKANTTSSKRHHYHSGKRYLDSLYGKLKGDKGKDDKGPTGQKDYPKGDGKGKPCKKHGVIHHNGEQHH